MELHELKPTHKEKRTKRIARGGKRGTYSGKGQKGQRSRAGAKFEPIIRGLIKRYPKLRGYRFKPKKINLFSINVENLEKNFQKEEKVNPEVLIKKGIIRKIKGEIPKVKILAKGKLTKALIVEDCFVSKGAKEKIEKAGGTIKLKVKSQKSKVKS